MNKKPQDYEERTLSVELRAVQEGDAPPAIVGYAAVTGSLSEDLGGFREIIEPGFFRDVLNDDVRALWNHNDDYVLGRTRASTLSLSEDPQGLKVTILPPVVEPEAAQWAKDAMVSIRRGDVDQMSFAFSVRQGGDKWETDGAGNITRRLLPGGCKRLLDVSPVTFPAYPATSVAARSMVDALQRADSEPRQAAQGTPEQEPTQARLDSLKRQIDIAERMV